jgi:hypothetical protein
VKDVIGQGSFLRPPPPTFLRMGIDLSSSST